MKITKKISFTPKLGQDLSLEKSLYSLTKQSKKEDGCLFYYFFKQEQNFIILEAWEDSSSLESHKQTPHFNLFKQQTLELVESKTSKEWDFLL